MSDGSINYPLRTSHPSAPTIGRVKEYIYDDGVTTPQPYYILSDGVPRPSVTTAGVTDHEGLTNKGTKTHEEIDSHIDSTENPHNVTKTMLGLSNVDNTSDESKPVSTAQQQAINDALNGVSEVIKNYLDRHYHQDNDPSSNVNQTNLQTRFSESFTLSHTAKYKVQVSFEASNSVNWNDFRAEMVVGGNVVRSPSMQQAQGNGQQNPMTLEYIYDASAGENLQVELKHGVEQQGTSTIYSHTCTVERFI